MFEPLIGELDVVDAAIPHEATDDGGKLATRTLPDSGFAVVVRRGFIDVRIGGEIIFLLEGYTMISETPFDTTESEGSCVSVISFIPISFGHRSTAFLLNEFEIVDGLFFPALVGGVGVHFEFLFRRFEISVEVVTVFDDGFHPGIPHLFVRRDDEDVV